MIYRASKCLLMLVFFVLSALSCRSQAVSASPLPPTLPVTGIYPFGSYGGGPDVVNLGNLNVHLTIPIRYKTGRGIDFQYSIGYDSSIWVNDQGTWDMLASAGWQAGGNQQLTGGVIEATAKTSQICPDGTVVYTYWSDFVYTDALNVMHPLPGTISVAPASLSTVCPSSGQTPSFVYSGFPGTATDGSGISIIANQSFAPYQWLSVPNNLTVLLPGGMSGSIAATTQTTAGSYGPIFNNGSVAYLSGATDLNGNQITAPAAPSCLGTYYDPTDFDLNNNCSVTGTYTDTLGQTALTVSLTTNPSNTSPLASYSGDPVSQQFTYSYPGPNGTTSQAVLHYLPQNVFTTFACPGINESTGPINTVYGGDRPVDGAPRLGPVLLPDYLLLPDGTSYKFTYEVNPFSPSNTTGRIASVTFPGGGSVSYVYGMIDCSSGSPMSLTRTVNDGNGNISTWTYVRTLSYATQLTTPALAYLSFTTVTDPVGNQQLYQFAEEVPPNPTPTVAATPLLYFYETSRLEQDNNAGHTLRYTTTSYNNNWSTTLPILNRTVTTSLGGTPSQVVETYDLLGNQTQINTYDYSPSYSGVGPLLTSRTTYYVNVADVFESVRSVTDENGVQTIYNYDENPLTATSGVAQHVVGANAAHLNLTSVLKIGGGPPTRVSSYTYFDTGKVQTSTDSTTGAVTTYSYSGTGQCASAFPTNTSLPVTSPTGTVTATLTTSTSYDCIGGVPTSTTDVNGNVSTLTYSDPMWRLTSSVDGLGQTTSLTYPTVSSNMASVTKSYTGGGPTTTTLIPFHSEQYTTFDGLQRPILQQSSQGPSAFTLTSIASQYDLRGNLSYTSIPYTAGVGVYTPTGPGTQSFYDALGRLWKTIDAGGGTVGYTYNDNDVLVTSGPVPTTPTGSPTENVKARQLEYNGAGQLTSVCEIVTAASLPSSGSCGQNTPASGYLTVYGYSGSLLKSITQNLFAGSSPTFHTFSYDGQSRLTKQVMPETGTTTFTYDSDPSGICPGTYKGSIVKSVDNAGNSTCYTYDSLHRQLSSVVASGPYASVTPQSNFVYDVASYAGTGTAMQNALGTLVEAYTCTAPCTPNAAKLTDVYQNTYPEKSSGGVPTGRVFSQTWESTPNSGGYFETQSISTAQGALTNLTSTLNGASFGFPALAYGLDLSGRHFMVNDTTNNLSLVRVATYNQLTGSPTQVAFGNGDNDTFNYDPNTGRPIYFASSIAATTPFYVTGQLMWNANGSLQNFMFTDSADPSKSQNCSYTADDLSRLSSVSCFGGWVQSFSYDALGNIAKLAPQNPQPGQFTQTYQPGPYNATNQLPIGNPVHALYDANGNQTLAEGVPIQWNASNQPALINNSTTATYDALGRLVEKGTGGVYTQVVYDSSGNKLATVQAGQLVQGTVSLPGGETAVYGGSGFNYFRHTDWLGSSLLATTWTHQVYSKEAYAPFGENYNEYGIAPDRSFTGQDQDTATGAYDFLFRKYDPTAGRWLSPDPSVLQYADLTNPQSLNLYVYARNNPLVYVDPNGLDACVYNYGNGTAYIRNGDNGGEVACEGDGVYITTPNYVSAVGYDGTGTLNIYGANGSLYSPDGTPYVAQQSITVGDDGNDTYVGAAFIVSPGIQISYTQAPSNVTPQKNPVQRCNNLFCDGTTVSDTQPTCGGLKKAAAGTALVSATARVATLAPPAAPVAGPTSIVTGFVAAVLGFLGTFQIGCTP